MATVTEAEGLAELGLWQDAWDVLEELPAAERGLPPALRVRLDLCPYLSAWNQGDAIANVLRDGGEDDRKAAASYFRERGKHWIELGDTAKARAAIRDCAATWPAARADLLDDPQISGLV